MQRMIAVIAIFAAAALGGLGCHSTCHDDVATCGQSPSEPIVGFRITITTGDEGSFSDIKFCYQRKSEDSGACWLMDKGVLYNDFQAHQTDTYTVHFDPIAVGDFDRFWVWNDTVIDDWWDIAAIEVTALLASGAESLLYQDDYIDCQFDIGPDEYYIPKSCDY
ncbi:MAG: hypothetical protein ACK2U9_05195 [Anaerolineae bacterium]